MKKKKLGGRKFDGGKSQLSLLSTPALLELTKVLEMGAIKYGRGNWREGFVWSRVYDAALRHLLAYNNGERIDPESGLSHLNHSMANLMFLIHFEQTGTGLDDLGEKHAS